VSRAPCGMAFAVRKRWPKVKANPPLCGAGAAWNDSLCRRPPMFPPVGRAVGYRMAGAESQGKGFEGERAPPPPAPYPSGWLAYST